MIDYEQEVRKVYPNARWVQLYNEWCDNLPIGVRIIRYRKVLGMDSPFLPIQIGFGYTISGAWKSAYAHLVSSGKITFYD